MHSAHARPLVGLSLGAVLVLALTSLAADPVAVNNDDPQWLKQIQKPADWITFGGDFRFRHEFIANPFLIAVDPPGHEWSFNRYRGRLWSTITPAEPVDLNVRLTWEGRYWFTPEDREGFHQNEIIWDNLNGRFKFGDAKTGPSVIATIGRQDIILGDGWLVLEGTPLDGSRSIYFDAARFTITLNPKIALDAIYIENRAQQDDWLRPFNSEQVPNIEQNERGAILWAAWKPTKQTEVDGYFIWKHTEAIAPNGDTGDSYTVGARVVQDFNEHWRARAEGAYQFGTRHNPTLFPDSNGEVQAFGFLSRLTYSFNDNLKNQIFLEGEFLSGDNSDTRRIEQFDSLWGRWPQYSELYVYDATVDGRIADVSNMARINLGWICRPTPKMEVSLAYHAMFAPENPRAGRPGFSPDGYFRGQLITAALKYQFTSHISGHLWGEWFLPGNYHADAPGGPFSSRQDLSMFLRAELMVGF